MPSSTIYGIRTITEQSVLAWFQANAADMLPGVQIHAGQTDEIRSVPIIILHAETAQAASELGAKPLGNFELTLKIYVYSSADDSTIAQHRERVENVQAIMQDVEGLSAAWTTGSLYAAWIVSDDEGVSDRRFGNVLSYSVFAVYPPA
jgi:hypothetical protein